MAKCVKYRAVLVLLERGTGRSIADFGVRLNGTYPDSDSAIRAANDISWSFFGDLYGPIGDIVVSAIPVDSVGPSREVAIGTPEHFWGWGLLSGGGDLTYQNVCQMLGVPMLGLAGMPTHADERMAS